MASFNDALESMSSLLSCPLCENELQSTVTVKECGHHFCQQCIYPILGTLCKCPTCSIPARVGNLIRNPSYDILVACTNKLRALRLGRTKEGSTRRDSLASSLGQGEGTQLGSPVWTFDCGPTFPSSLPASLQLPSVEMQTFPSPNAAMASHRRERAVRFRDMVQEAENQSTSDQAASSNAEGVVGDEHGPYQESGARQNMQPPPPPTLLQLQRLLNIRREANVVESSQETESLHPTVDLSQPPDDEVASNDNEQYATPRMPSPSLQGLQLTLESLPVRGKVVDFNGETSHHGVRPSRKHRMSDDEEEAEYTNMIPATESSKGTREDSTNKRPCTNSNPQDVAEGEAGNQVIVCIFTGLGKDQRALFDQNIARVIEAGLLMEHIQDQTFSVTTSHIITNADADASKRTGLWLCPRMLKYLHGMLSEPWIVRHEWFVDSIDAKAWLPLPDSNYLIQGDTQFGPAPGTQKRREIRSRKTLKLFASCRVFFYGSFGTSFTKDELMRLVRDGGAETLHRRPTAKQPTLPPSTPPLIGMSTKSMPSAMEFFAPDRSFLYVSEDTEPWKVPLDKTVPIIVCDPTSIPSGPISGLSAAHSRKHGWLCDHQAVSLTWLLNCISCSLMGVQDIELLYGSSDERDSEFGNEEIRQLSQAWNSWRDKK